MNAQLKAEFDQFLDAALAGKAPRERLDTLLRLRTQWEREGRVPVNGKVIALGPQHRAVSYTLPTTAAPQRVASPMSRGRLLFGSVLIVVFLGLLTRLFGGTDGIPGPTVPSQPVTAAADGPTAPVSLALGDQTLIVHSFDPALDWPDVTSEAVGGAALWGKTTINVVLGVDATALDDELARLTPGATITVQQAQGTQVTYRVVERVTATTTAIHYAAQTQVGLTLVGMAPGPERLIIRAVPDAVPVSVTELGDVRVAAESAQWTAQADASLALQVALSLTVPGTDDAPPAAWPLTITVPAGTTQVVTVTPARAAQTQMISVTVAAAAPTLELGLTLPGDVRGQVSLAVPPRPTATVEFATAERTATGLRVRVTITPDGPVALPAAGLTCRSAAATVPLVIEGMTLPTVLTVRKEVVADCAFPDGVRGPVEVLVLDDRAVVSIP